MKNESALPKLTPLLIVRDAAHAIDFYIRALGASEVARFIDKRQGSISHADLAVGDVTFSVTEEARAWNSAAPPSLGGSPVVLQLQVKDVDATFERMCSEGATVVFFLMDFCGERMGRVRDPFGHLWILTQRLEELSVDEIQRRRNAWTPSGASKVRQIAATLWALTCFGCHQQIAKSEQNVIVGSLSLHIVCSGKGSPPVVLDSGLGADSTAWAEVQPEVARFTHACAYDRAGLGSSSPALRPHTLHQMASELRDLVKSAQVPGPYVFVGHSMGGVNVRLLASEDPQDVAGMVLLDSMTAEQVSRYWSLIPEGRMKEFRAAVGKLPEGIDFDVFAKELSELRPGTAAMADQPLVVLVRGKEEAFPGASPEVTAQMLAAWQDAQSSLRRLSNNESYIVVAESGHAIQHDAPHLVVSAIREVVEAARGHRVVERRNIASRAR